MASPFGALKRAVYRFRDAITGRFTTPGYAREHPDTTVREEDHR